MILSILATAILAALAMAPGWVLIRGRANHPGQISAAMAVSLTLTMLGTALIGVALEGVMGWQMPAWSLGVFALIALVLAAYFSGGLAGLGDKRDAVEAPGFLIGLAFAGFGLFSLWIAIGETPDGGLLVHSWYNADWFKHLGHVHAIANEGVPARDIFGGGAPLYYYWLVYILPGAGAAIGGDAWAALSTANAIITVLFTTTLYGLVRYVAPLRMASLVTFLALFITAPIGFFLIAVFGEGLQFLLDMPDAPKGPALISISQFIPQHALAATVFMAWALLAENEESTRLNPMRLASLIALASVLTISTLMGATLLIAYGLSELYRNRAKAIPELIAMVILVAALAAAIGVVQLSNPDSALESPLFINTINTMPWHTRALSGVMQWMSYCGPAFMIAVFLLFRWKPKEKPYSFAKTISVSLIIAAGISVAATQILGPERIAIETVIRAVIPAGIATGIIGGWAATSGWRSGGRTRLVTVVLGATLVIMALPCVYVRTVWMTDFSDQHTTLIGADDRLALQTLRERSDVRDQVWQYPEAPRFSRERGGDNWSVIMAGRTVPNSERATDYGSAAIAIEQTKRFFGGEDVEIPGVIDWVYVSRALEPGGYEVTVARLKTDIDWDETVCYPDACLFERVSESAK